MPVRRLSPTLSPTIYLAPARHLVLPLHPPPLSFQKAQAPPLYQRPSIPQPPYRRTGLHLHRLHLCSTHPSVCDSLDLAHRSFNSMITGRIPRLLAFRFSFFSHTTRFLVLLPTLAPFPHGFSLVPLSFFPLSTRRHPLASFCPLPPQGQDCLSLSVAFLLHSSLATTVCTPFLVARPPLHCSSNALLPLNPEVPPTQTPLKSMIV